MKTITEREILIELLSGKSIDTLPDIEFVADYLLENGVIVPPVKVGGWVYEIQNNKIAALRISSITIFKNSIEMCCHIEEDYCRYFTEANIGSTIFLTIDEAKKALKEREQ